MTKLQMSTTVLIWVMVPFFQTWCSSRIWWYWLLCPPPPSTPLYAERWWLCYAGLVVNETCNLLSWVALCSTVFCIPFEHFIYIPFPSRHCPTRISPLFSYSRCLKITEKLSRSEQSELTI